MTNTIAIWLGVFLLGAICIDYIFYGTEHFLFLGKRGIELLDWIAFWR